MSRSHSERDELISQAFVTLADTLVDEYDVIDLLDRLTGFCVQLLPADAAGIVLGDARWELRAVAASDDAAHVMKLSQLHSDEGPCLDCFQSGAPVTVNDLTEGADRWPAFVAALAWRTDFRSVHALPLRLRGRAIGALNLFTGVPGPLPEPDLALGQALADVAPIGILQERAIRHRGGAQRAAAGRAPQPRHHRTGQGRPGPVRRVGPGRSVPAVAQPRPQPQPQARRTRTAHRRQKFDLAEILVPGLR
jgi:GAF domain-containing protein